MRILMIAAAKEDTAAAGYASVAHLAHLIGAYYVFLDAGAELVMASRLGGAPPIGNLDDAAELPAELRGRFTSDERLHDEIADTLCLDQICEMDFRAVFCIGLTGFDGPVPADDQVFISIKTFLASGKPVALICSQPAIAPGVTDSGLLMIGQTVGSSIFAATALLGGLGAEDVRQNNIHPTIEISKT